MQLDSQLAEDILALLVQSAQYMPGNTTLDRSTLALAHAITAHEAEAESLDEAVVEVSRSQAKRLAAQRKREDRGD